MIILLDQDGPLADFEGGFLEQWRAKFPNEIFIPLEQRKSFYIVKDYPVELKDKIEGVCYAPGFYLNLPPVSGAIDAVKQLVETGNQVIICTTPFSQYENCVLEKYQWLEKYLGRDFTRKIILTRDKTLIRGDILIDDKPEITGIAQPEWEHIVFDFPYNRHVSGKRRITWENWKEVLGI